jgi:hypothetical protein
MRRTVTPLAFALLAGAALAAAPARADSEVVHDEAGGWEVDGARLITVEVPVGEVRVSGIAGDRIEARLRVRCERDTRRCRDDASRVRLRPRRSGASIELEVVGMEDGHHGRNSPNAWLELQLPAELGLRVELGVGEVDVRGLLGDVDVEAGVGEVEVTVLESAVREVSLDVGVGEAKLLPRGSGARTSSFLFLGNEVDWREGTGTAEVAVELGVGEATVRLQP